MACCPPEITQIFNSSAPATSNSYRFRVPSGQEGQLTATGLEPGDEIQVLTQDPNDPTVWVPMTIGGVPVVLTSTNPSVDLPPGLYRVVPSASVADNDPPVIVSGFTYRDVGLTSVAAYYGTTTSYEEVEIVRVSEFGDPRLYRAGTDEEIKPFDPALLFYELPSSGGASQPVFEESTTYLLIGVGYDLDLAAGEIGVVQNRSGTTATYTYDGINFYELADRETITFTQLGSVYVTNGDEFSMSPDNPGLIISVFQT